MKPMVLPIKGMENYQIKLQMKFIILACFIALGFSVTVTNTTLTWTAAFNTGTTTNATCALTGTFSGTYASMTNTSATTEQMGLWVASTSAVTTTSTSDYLVFIAWAGTSVQNSSTTFSTTFATVPSATLYGSSGSAWTASSATLTTNGSTITTAGTVAFTTYLPFTATNMTSSNFTKSSLSWNYWVYIAEGSTAYTQSSNSWTGSTAGSTTIGFSACTAGMAAIKSGSIATSILSSIFALSFF